MSLYPGDRHGDTGRDGIDLSTKMDGASCYTASGYGATAATHDPMQAMPRAWPQLLYFVLCCPFHARGPKGAPCKPFRRGCFVSRKCLELTYHQWSSYRRSHALPRYNLNIGQLWLLACYYDFTFAYVVCGRDPIALCSSSGRGRNRVEGHQKAMLSCVAATTLMLSARTGLPSLLLKPLRLLSRKACRSHLTLQPSVPRTTTLS